MILNFFFFGSLAHLYFIMASGPQYELKTVLKFDNNFKPKIVIRSYTERANYSNSEPYATSLKAK